MKQGQVVMRRIDYRRVLKRNGYMAFAKALMDLAEAKSGNTLSQTPLNELWPCTIRKNSRSGKLELRRLVLYRDGRQYVLKSEAIQKSKTQFSKIKALRKCYVNAAKFLCGEIQRGKLKGIISLPYEPYVVLDDRNENILRSQFEILCAASYVGLLRSGGDIHYGMVMLSQRDIDAIKKRYTAATSSWNFRKLTPEIEAAYGRFIGKLVQAVSTGKGADRTVRFAAEDIAVPEVRQAIGAMMEDEEFAKLGISKNGVLKQFKKHAPKRHPCFPKKEGGKRSKDRRDAAWKLISEVSAQIVSERSDIDSEGEDVDT